MPDPKYRLLQQGFLVPLPLASLGILLCLASCNSDTGSTSPASSNAAAATSADAAAQAGSDGTASSSTSATWDLITGTHASDQIDTKGWLPLSIALDSMTASSPSPRLAIQPASDSVTTVSLDGKPVATLTRDIHGVTIHATPGNIHLAYTLSGVGTTPLTIRSDNDYQLVLSDAHLASPDGPALDLQSGSTAFLELKGASTLADTDTWGPRTDADGKTTQPTATLSAGGPLVVRGDGSLKVDSRAHHALATAGHIRLSSGNLSLAAAARDGLRASHAFIMDGGQLGIDAPAGKGIKVNGEESATQPLGFVAINDGHLTIKSHDKAITAGWKAKEDAKTPGTSDDPDPRVTISGGTLDITTTGKPVEDTNEGEGGLSPEGIEAKSAITVRGGNLTLNTTDDCFNAGTRFELSDGRVYAYSSLQDAVDSNGTMTISGGVLVAVSHAPRPEGALDSDSHEFAIKGGTFVGIGAYNSTPTASASTQNAIAIPTYVEAGRWTLRDTANNAVFSYDLPFRAGYLIASTPALAQGATYTVVRGGTPGPIGEDFHGMALKPTTLAGGTPGDTFSITDTLTHLGATEFNWYSPELGPGD